jgi:hypothetical protein
MEGTRPITLSLAAAILILFAFVNLAFPLMRGPSEVTDPSISGQLLARGSPRGFDRLAGSSQAQTSSQSQSSAAGFPGFGGNNSASGPNIPALLLLCIAMLFSALAFFAAVGLLQTRLYGLILAIIASAALLFFSTPILLANILSGITNTLPWETIIEVFTGAATLILVLLPVSLRAFRKSKDGQENTDY